MPNRSTRITLQNETAATLTLISSGVDGQWTDGGWAPPPVIAPFSSGAFQGESTGVFTDDDGTQGSVVYAIAGTGQQLSIAWNNPGVGLNNYQQSVAGPYGLYFSGGKGNNAEATYFLIPDSRVAVTPYLPGEQGFHFSNTRWGDEHITSITLPDPFGDILIGNASWGLCGGMSFASRDYFEAGQWAPAQTTNPPGEGDPLFDYIVQRLGQSLNVGDAADFVKYADPLYPDTDSVFGDGRAWVMAHVAWPGIRDVIDAGHPCPIGLVIGKLPDVKGIGHQVCAYAYQLAGQVLTLWVYDPNSPGNDDVTLQLDISRTDQKINVASTVNVPNNPSCFFTQSYEQRNPVAAIPVRTSGSSAVGRTGEHLDVLWAGRDGSVWSNWWDQNANHGAWNQPFEIAGALQAEASAAAMIARTGEHLDAFWIGRDGSVWNNWWDSGDNNGAWNQPGQIAGPLLAEAHAITAVARTPEHADVFWIGRDGSVWSAWWDQGLNHGVWNPPFQIAGPTMAEAGAIAAVTRTSEHVDLFWIGRDGSVWSSWWDQNASNGAWNQPFEIAGPTMAEAGAITAISRTPEHIDVFWIGRDGSVWSNWWDQNASNGAWNQPFEIAGAQLAEPGAIASVARTPEHIDVFWIGRDGSVWSNWWDQNASNGAWNQPFEIAGATMAEPGSIAAVTRTPQHVDVFWIGRDGSVWSNWWDQNASNGAWNQPFEIAGATMADVQQLMLRPATTAAVAREQLHLDVFWTAADGSVRSTWWDQGINNARWNAVFDVGAAGSAAPGTAVAAVAREQLHVDVFWAAPDGSVRSGWWDQGINNAVWNQPFDIAPPGSTTAGATVAAVAREQLHLDVFWAGPDGSVASAWWDQDTGWNAPFSIAPPGSATPGGSVAAVAREQLHLDVFWAAPDGSVRSAWWDQDTGWNAPFSIAPPGSAAPGSCVAAVARERLHLDVFWAAPDGSVLSAWWDQDTGWNAPFSIAPPGSAAPGSWVAAVAREQLCVDVFWMGPDGSVRTAGWDQGARQAVWAPPADIAPGRRVIGVR